MTKTIEEIQPNKVTVDLTVERLLDQRRVAAIAADLHPEAIGLPAISRRGSALIVIDGQHRLEALKVNELGDVPLPCAVYDGLTLEQEAELFRLLNATKALSAIDKFRISLVEKNPTSLAIDAIVERNGYVTRPGSPNSCIAVTTLRHIWSRDQGDTLNRSLSVASATWGHRKHATHQTILQALASMLFRYGNTVNLTRLADKIRTERDAANPTQFLGTMRALADTTGTTPSDAGAGKLVTIYNRNYPEDSTNRLANWK
jgi:hypothetical protein